MTKQDAFEIVLDLARQNVIDDPSLSDEADRQLEAINLVEEYAYGDKSNPCV